MDSLQGTGIQKKFTLASPEGIGLIIIAIAIGCGLFYGWTEVATAVVQGLTMAFESIWIGLGCVLSIGFIGWLFRSKKLHLILWNIYKLTMRGFAGIFIEMDPIGIIKNRVEKMRAKKEDLEHGREDESQEGGSGTWSRKSEGPAH